MSKEQWQSYFPEDTTYDDDGSVRNCSGNFYNGSLGMYITKLQSDNERLQEKLDKCEGEIKESGTNLNKTLLALRDCQSDNERLQKERGE